MANVSRVNGFQPVSDTSSGPYTGGVTRYFVPATDATALFVGDLVSLAATSDPVGQIVNGVSYGDIGGVRSVTQCAVGGVAVGSIVAIQYNPANLNSPIYRPASTAAFVYVVDDPDAIFECQANATVASTQYSKNANHVNAGGSTVTGLSGEQLDVSTAATTATLTLKIIGAAQRIDNDITTTNQKLLVRINSHAYSAGVTGV